ncbi:gustatory receptor for sugar taste 43a isoform X2 [Cephus cinctus]|uniref:Gustatory receptor n=1 Tax=Cephus cinctus TaxID=211228 RepID=A0AAJ7RE40_CEPCN|nr:gustatory receptor for sugar taste 43a isoform X2 [Cephus cinctus]
MNSLAIFVTSKTKAGIGKECESERQTEVMSTTVKSDLYQSLIPAYYLSKVCGLLPVRFVQQNPGRYWGRLHFRDIIYRYDLWLGILKRIMYLSYLYSWYPYSICLLVFLMSCAIFGLWRDLRDGWENSTRMKSSTAVVVTCGDVSAVLFLAIVSILGSPFRWSHLQHIINNLVKVDEKLSIVSPKKTRRYAIFLITISLVYLISISSLDLYSWSTRVKISNQKSDKGPMNYIPIYFLYVIVIMIEAQYTLLTYNIGERFGRLNQTLKNVLKTEKITESFKKDFALGSMDSSVLSSGQKLGVIDHNGSLRLPISLWEMVRVSGCGNESGIKSFLKYNYYCVSYLLKFVECRNVADTISQLITVHSSLCDTVLLINTAFGVPVLVVTLTCLLHLIITPYVLIIDANGSNNGLFLATQCLWCVLHIGRMFIIVQPCYEASTKAKTTAVIVSQLLSWNLDSDIRKQLEIFSLQLLHRPIDFSACGLFSLDRSLVTSIVGSVTTYLVILIQFQKADDTKDTNDILKNATQLIRNVSTFRNIDILRKST